MAETSSNGQIVCRNWDCGVQRQSLSIQPLHSTKAFSASPPAPCTEGPGHKHGARRGHSQER